MMGSTEANEPAPPPQSGGASTELLFEAGAVLAGSLDPDATMREVAELMVPRLGDLCVIDFRADDGSIRGAAVAATDPQLEVELVELRRRYPLDPAGEHPVARVQRSGRPELLTRMTSSMLESFAGSAVHARFMIEHDYASAIVAPMIARDRTIGALSVLRLGEREPFAAPELELVCELARRVALAIDNERLYSELRMLEQRLEAILAGLAEAITVVDEHGRTVFANAAAAALLGAGSPAELLGLAPGALMGRFLVLDEHGRELALDEMPARRLLRGEPTPPPPLLVRNVARDGARERWLMVRASPVVEPSSGRMTHIVNVFEDVTELKRAELAERLLAEASRVLATTPSARALAQVAGMAVQTLADWCAIDLLDERGEFERVATRAGRAGAIEAAAIADDPQDRRDLEALIRSTGTRVWPQDAHGGGEPDDHMRLLRSRGATAVIAAPLIAGGGALGVMTLARARAQQPFAPADVALAQELGRRIGTAVANARRHSERARIAHVLQQALLPQSIPQSETLELHAVYEAAGELNEVGGDFYDVFEYDDERLLVLIGDVCGKGPHAAGVTALARHTLRAAAISGQPPVRMLETLHQALLRRPKRPEPCTVCVVLVHPRRGRAQLTVALAGHPPPLVIGANGAGARPVGRVGTLLGAVDPICVHETPAELRDDETLLLYTDGILDAGRPHRRLGEEGLIDLAARAPRATLGALVEHLRSRTISQADGALRDDIALLAVRLRAAGDAGGAVDLAAASSPRR